MQIYSTYSIKIKHYNHIFKDTVSVYRDAVDFLITVCLNEWEDITVFTGHNRLSYIESLIHVTGDHPDVKYTGFDKKFYKFPCYLRRGAINEAIGKVSSYKCVEINLLFQELDLLIHACTGLICTNKSVHMKQVLKSLSVIPGIGSRYSSGKLTWIILKDGV